MRTLGLALFLAALAATVAVPAAAQQPRPQPAPRPEPAAPAWLGVSYDVRWIQWEGRCASQIIAETVVQGSPAERAGLRAGDVIVAIDGDASPARRLGILAGYLAPGDSVRLRVARGDGATRELIAVADRRPERPPPSALARLAVQGASGRPVIQISGDSLVGTGLAPTTFTGGSTGFWLTDVDGRTAYRVLAAQPRTELGRRVADLMECARTPQPAPALASRGRLEFVHEVQARADSLRGVIARRALEGGEERRVLVYADPDRWQPAAPGAVFVAPPSGPVAAAPRPPVVMGLEAVMAASLYGVAGAEITALEPELAEYFRGVRTGLLVLRVAPGTAADRAGLRPGDVITAAGGADLTSPRDLRAAFMDGDAAALDLSVIRQGRRRAVRVERP